MTSSLVLPDDPLAPAFGAGGGALVGYARVSTRDQKLDRQLAALQEVGCVRVFADKASGRNAERTELWAALDYLRPGDTLTVTSLDRLGRSLQDLISIVSGLRKREVGFRSLHEALDTTTPGGRLVFHVFAALAEFIRELIVEGTREGLDAARAGGTRLGRPPALTPEQVRHARALLTQPDATVASIARLLGVSRSTLYKHVPELSGTGSRTAAVQDPQPVLGLPAADDPRGTTEGAGEAAVDQSGQEDEVEEFDSDAEHDQVREDADALASIPTGLRLLRAAMERDGDLTDEYTTQGTLDALLEAGLTEDHTWISARGRAAVLQLLDRHLASIPEADRTVWHSRAVALVPHHPDLARGLGDLATALGEPHKIKRLSDVRQNQTTLETVAHLVALLTPSVAHRGGGRFNAGPELKLSLALASITEVNPNRAPFGRKNPAMGAAIATFQQLFRTLDIQGPVASPPRDQRRGAYAPTT